MYKYKLSRVHRWECKDGFVWYCEYTSEQTPLVKSELYQNKEDIKEVIYK